MQIETNPGNIVQGDAWNLCSYLDGFKGVVLGCNITPVTPTVINIAAGLIITSGKTYSIPASSDVTVGTNSFFGYTISGINGTPTFVTNSDLSFWSDNNDLFLNQTASTNVLVGIRLGSTWNVNTAQQGVDINTVISQYRPVNSIMVFLDSTNPNNLYPGTTWVQLPDGFFLTTGGTGNTLGTAISVGTVSITTSTFTLGTIPNHSHAAVGHTHTTATHFHNVASHSHAIGAHTHAQGTNVLGSSQAPSSRTISDTTGGQASVRWLATSNTNRSRGGTTSNVNATTGGGNVSSVNPNTGSTTMSFNQNNVTAGNWGSATVSGHNHTYTIGYVCVAVWRRSA